MSISSAHCVLGRAPGYRRPHLRPYGRREHFPVLAAMPSGGVRWERPHDHERRRRPATGL